MATALKLKADIKKLKAAINSKATPKSYLPKLKEQLSKAENELESVQKGGKPRKTSTTKKTATTLSALEKLIKKKQFAIYRGAGVDLKKDAGEGAMKTGRRVSKGLKSNQYGSAAENKGNVYYEYRPNRIDVKQPKRKQTYPKLADGGKLYARGGGVDKKYTHFAVRKSDNLILTGWDYKGVDKESISHYTKGDLIDMDVKPSDYKILTKTFLKAKGIDPFSWDNWVSSKKLAKGGGFDQYGQPYGFDDEPYDSDSVYEYHYKEGYEKPHMVWDKIDGEYVAGFESRQKALKWIDSNRTYASGGYMAKGGEIGKKLLVQYWIAVNKNETDEIIELSEKLAQNGISDELKNYVNQNALFARKNFPNKEYDNNHVEKMVTMSMNSYKIRSKYEDGGYMAKGGKMFPHKIVLVKPDGEQIDVATFTGQGDAYSCANHLTNSNSMGYTYKVVSKKADGGELHRTEE